MFNVSRTFPRPNGLENGRYNTPEVFKELIAIFHGKCYLCESANLNDPEIEHLIHHNNDNILKSDWNNLFYSCSRCNSIKSDVYNIVNCCDTQANVSQLFRHLLPSIPGSPIDVEATKNADYHKVKDTVGLLRRCYNDESTSARRLTRTNLIEAIFTHYCIFILQRTTLCSNLSTVSKKRDAKDQVLAMIDSKYPFSIFWKWHTYSDSRLCIELGIRDEIFDM